MNEMHLSASAQRVQDALDAAGIPRHVCELSALTRTAEDAAHAIGCEVGQIAKSLIFRGRDSGEPVLFMVSGSNRVDVAVAATAVGEALAKADADFVREKTGFAIGGVPPAGHATPMHTYVDRDLLGYERIWAAAGTPRAVFELTPAQLVELTGGRVVSLT